jgi:hypothetical protein
MPLRVKAWKLPMIGRGAVATESPHSAFGRTLSAGPRLPVPHDDERDADGHDDQPDQQFDFAHAATQRSEEDDHKQQECPNAEKQIPSAGPVRHVSNVQRGPRSCRVSVRSATRSSAAARPPHAIAAVRADLAAVWATLTCTGTGSS